MEAKDGGELFGELYPSLRGFAGVIRPAGWDPDDLVQEALARTLARRSLDSIDNPAAYLRTVMVRVASNATRTWRRAFVRDARVAPRDESVDRYPSDIADLQRVPVRARAVLFLTVIDGLTYRDAARLVGCSEEAARAMASRALKQLRSDLAQEMAS
jgi:RNA polymerase sigma factor (sigma-70 family)